MYGRRGGGGRAEQSKYGRHQPCTAGPMEWVDISTVRVRTVRTVCTCYTDWVRRKPGHHARKNRDDFFFRLFLKTRLNHEPSPYGTI